MRIWVTALVLVLVVAAAIAIKLVLRRHAPDGGWFTDSSRSAGTLSLIGTMFAVLLAFLVLFALQSYQRARSGSSVEAIAVTELDSIAEVFHAPLSDHLHGGLRYAYPSTHSVTQDEQGNYSRGSSRSSRWNTTRSVSHEPRHASHAAGLAMPKAERRCR